MVVVSDKDISYRNEMDRSDGEHSTFLQGGMSQWVDCHKMEEVAENTQVLSNV